MADPVASNGGGPFATLDIDSGVAVVPGDLLYYDTTTNELKKADASDPATYAEWVAMTAGTGGVGAGTCLISKRAIFTDSDAPYTPGAAQYLSATAGEITETRPATAGDLIQRVGVAISTTQIMVEIHSPYEVIASVQEVLLEDTAARLVVDTGPAAGVTLAAAADDVTWALPIPENAVGIASGWLEWSCDVTLDVSDTMSVAIASAHHGEANDVVTDAVATTAATCTADELARLDISGGLDAAGIVKPSGQLFINVTKVAEGAGADDMTLFPPVVMWLCV